MSDVRVGTFFSGFTGGYFGRDAYGVKTCIAVGFYAEKEWALFHIKSEFGSPDTFEVLVGEEIEMAAEADRAEARDLI
jgi:hypothetical protein